MNRRPVLTNDVRIALEAAGRRPGWNTRPRTVKRFELGECTLFVVPFRRWVYRRREKCTEAWWSLRTGNAGPT